MVMQVLVDGKNFDKAIEDFNKAIALTPGVQPMHGRISMLTTGRRMLSVVSCHDDRYWTMLVCNAPAPPNPMHTTLPSIYPALTLAAVYAAMQCNITHPFTHTFYP